MHLSKDTNTRLSLTLHRGINEMIRRIEGIYTWQGLSRDIEKIMQNCHVCQQTETHGENLDNPNKRNTQFCLQENKHKETLKKTHVVTIRDELAKFPKAYALSNKTSKSFTSTLILYFQHYGTTLRFHCDFDSEFNKAMLRDLCKLFYN